MIGIPLPYKILGISLAFLCAILGAGWWGYNQGKMVGKVAIAEYSQKQEEGVNKLNTKITMDNEKRVVEYVDRIKTVEKIKTVYVKAAAETVPSQFNLSKAWVYTHNQAALNNPTPDVTLMSDPTPSTITDTKALEVVTTNYSSCEADRLQLSNLIATIRNAQDEVKKNNEEAK